MTEQTRPIRCHHFRATDSPCMELATVEVLGPAPTVLCEEHARYRLEQGLEEGWEQYGAEEYARMCEDAASVLSTRISDRHSNPLLCQIIEEATTYLEEFELERAREQLIAEGGTPRPTATELEMLRAFERDAQRFGWTYEPAWVPRVREWAREAAKQ